MTDFETPSIQPDQPRIPTMRCPDCRANMSYRGERKNPVLSKYRDDVFYCPGCRIEILRPNNV
jgi:hypothetical protein